MTKLLQSYIAVFWDFSLINYDHVKVATHGSEIIRGRNYFFSFFSCFSSISRFLAFAAERNENCPHAIDRLSCSLHSYLHDVATKQFLFGRIWFITKRWKGKGSAKCAYPTAAILMHSSSWFGDFDFRPRVTLSYVVRFLRRYHEGAFLI